MMQSTKLSAAPAASTYAIAWLILGFALSLISNGRWIVPTAVWISPIFLLHFLDITKARTGLALVLAGGILAWSISWRGMIPAPGIWYFFATTVYAFVYFLPFLAHRLIAPRLRGFQATLVFPTCWISVEYLLQQFATPYGSWVSLAYTQISVLPLIQVASITGTWGISFLITWFASTIAWLWQKRWATSAVKTASIFFAPVVLIVTAFGFARLAQGPEPAPDVRVALLVPSAPLQSALMQAFAPVIKGAGLNEQQRDMLLESASRLNRDLLQRSWLAAESGAQIIAWSETAGRVAQSMEEQLIEQGRVLVASHDAILIMAYGVWVPNGDPPLENKLVILEPGDSTPIHYHKARPIYGGESFVIDAGDGIVPILDTPFGRLSTVICHDLDFPSLVRQAGRNRARFMFGPSDDWADIADIHADMATLRAVENGFVLVRPTSGGHTIARDPYGRPIEFLLESLDVSVIETATGSTRTIYSRLGDFFAWLCIPGFIALLVRSRTSITSRR